MSLYLKNFIDVTRLNKPIGFLLLFWPCAWGLSLAYYFNRDLPTFAYYLFLFFCGSVLMRSAGCIVNDIVDEKIDKKVFRTKGRPIASGSLSKNLAWIYVLILCLLAFIVLIQFNLLTVYLGMFSMIFAFSYPFMKRFTYWPQLFLGITFNYGLILGWTAIKGEINFITILFYLGAIFWTLGYDTIYGYQDIKDDEIIGLKSTSIKFKGKEKKFIILCYTMLLFFLSLGGYFMKLNDFIYFILLLIPAYHLFFYQLKIFNPIKPENCLKAFKSNNFFVIIIFFNIVIIKLI